MSGRNTHVDNAGALRVVQRRGDYSDRRTDGYSEPLEVYILGTSHVSETSAADVRRVVGAVRPQSVVVEVGFARLFQRILPACLLGGFLELQPRATMSSVVIAEGTPPVRLYRRNVKISTYTCCRKAHSTAVRG